MPAIRDGRGVLTEYDMGTPPINPPGEVVRRQASAQQMADFAAERAAAAERRKKSPAVIDNPAAAAVSRQRGHEALRRARSVQDVMVDDARARATATEEEPVAMEHHDAGTNRIRQQVEAGHARKSGRRPGMRDARQIALATSLTPKQDAAIDALRVHGSRAAASEALGISKMALEARLNEAAEKDLLPRDLPDLPFRFRPAAEVSPAGLTAGEHRRAVKAAAAVHTESLDREAPAPVTGESVEAGSETPATAGSTPPGPPPGISEEYSARDSTPEAGGGPAVAFDGISIHLNIRIEAAEIASWRAERISSFFGGVAKLLAAYHQQAES